MMCFGEMEKRTDFNVILCQNNLGIGKIQELFCSEILRQSLQKI